MTLRAAVALAVAATAGSGRSLTAEEVELRAIVVSVTDDSGKSPTGLSATDFRGEFRGRPVEIVSTSVDGSPRRIAVVVDASGSSHREDAWTREWGLAHDAILSLTPGHEVVLCTLAGSLQVRSDLSSDALALRRKVLLAMNDRPAGGTAVYDGLVQASQAFSRPRSTDAVLLLSDGLDTISNLTWREAAVAIARRGVRVFWVRTGEEPTRPGLVDTSRIAWATGGTVLESRRETEDEASRLVQRACRLMTQTYRLGVAFPGGVDQPREWRLELVGPDRRRRTDVRLAYPSLVVPSAPD
jgi:Mg-chelatase subunit ChlD